MIKALIRRTDPLTKVSRWQEYQVPMEPDGNNTVLGLLHYIYTYEDSSLGYSYSCRFKHCGLCGIVVNGKAGLACKIRCQSELEIEPLFHLPVIRDLVIDRRFLLPLLKKHGLLPAPSSRKMDGTFSKNIVSSGYLELARCNECLCCLSSCPRYDYKDTGFGGPYLFVKAAQLAYFEDSFQGRLDLVHNMGITECNGCRKCICTSGVPIFKKAIQPFLYLLESYL